MCFVVSKKPCSKYIDFITKTRGWLHAGWMPLSLQICPAILVGVPASLMEYRLLKYEPVLLSIHLQAFGFLLTPPAEHEDEIKFLLYLFTLRCIRGSLNAILWCYFAILYFLIKRWWKRNMFPLLISKLKFTSFRWKQFYIYLCFLLCCTK